MTLTWGASTDANGAAVAGYNVYRSTTPSGPYAKVNSPLITNTQYTDSTVQSGTYYYVVKSLDSDGYESAGTLEMTVTVVTAAPSSSGETGSGGSSGRGVSVGDPGGASGGGGGGGCFISTMAK